jgi:LysM repeat protein
LLAVLLAGAARPGAVASPSPTAAAAGSSPPSSATPRRTATPRPSREPAEVTTYTVKEGDTLQSIARRHNTRVRELRALNPDIDDSIKPRDELEPGTKLKVPASSEG